jgi:hypothetical protein
VLRRIFVPKRNEVTGEWRRLHIKELYALYSSSNIIRVINSTRQISRACSTYRILVRKPEGKRLLKNSGVYGRIILKWILEKRDGGGVDWMYLTRDRDRCWAFVNAVMNLLGFINAGNSLNS